jgi:hypothetical protein
MTSTLPNKQAFLLEKLQGPWRLFNQIIMRTPQRSLEVECDSVMKIRVIEDELLNQNQNLQPSDFNTKAEEEYVKRLHISREKSKVAIGFLLTLIIVPLLTQHFSKQFLVNPVVEHFRHGNHTLVVLNSEMKEQALRELKIFEKSLQFDSLAKLAPALSSEEMEAKLQHKASEMTKEYWDKSNSAVSNIFADIFALLAFGLVIIFRCKELVILKSFIDDIMYGLSDSVKAFIIILFTNLFVGFHFPHGWEALPANHSFIFLFMGTFPVILDTILKYWIFRYLSLISPFSVGTFRNMNQ